MSEKCAICGFEEGDWEPMEREWKIHPTEHQFKPTLPSGSKPSEGGKT